MEKNKTDIKNMEIDELHQWFEGIGEKGFRAKQVYSWIYKGVTDFSDMRNLSKSLIEKLDSEAYISSLEIVTVQESKTDGTRKYLFELEDGNRIESVFMKYKYGNTLCVSSQAGCRMGCRFCASTLDGLRRNLTAGEIADQIIAAQRDTGEKIGHVVVMGTGEPFDNYDEISRFIRMINHKDGLNIGMRNITVSTCGIIPGIRAFSKLPEQFTLAISLHSAVQSTRNQLMPGVKKYTLLRLHEALQEYTEKTGEEFGPVIKEEYVHDPEEKEKVLFKGDRRVMDRIKNH